MRTFVLAAFVAWGAAGCRSAPPELLGYPANTPSYYTEDKMFFPKLLPAGEQHTATTVELEHVYQVDPSQRTPIQHGNPVAVILQKVRLPEDLPGGTRDIAVVLDINMDAEKGVQPLVAFYQRDIPGGQVLNFSNLLVFAVSEWDSSSPPYFRVRVLDVKAERNQRTERMLQAATNLTGEISGIVPHPIIPVVGRAIEAATEILSNRRNEVLLDFQLQLYGEQAERAGGATLGRLMEGEWLILGRRQGHGADFWADRLALDRQTDRIVAAEDRGAPEGAEPPPDAARTRKGDNIPVPYVSVVIVGANLQVSKLVMDRSAELIKLLSSPDGKTDVDALESASDDLAAAIRAHVAERRLVKYRSKPDMQAIVDLLQKNLEQKILGEHHVRRLVTVINRVVEPAPGFGSAEDAVKWWGNEGSAGRFQERADPKQGQLPVQWVWGN